MTARFPGGRRAGVDQGFRAVALVGISEGRHLATKPQLAQQMLAHAVGIPTQRVTGDCVYGDDRRLQMWLESCPQA